MFKFGIDWSEQHHNLCIRSDKGAIVSQVEFKHTLEGFQRFDDERHRLGVPAGECLVAICRNRARDRSGRLTFPSL
jgi:hypothetical protein